MPQPYAQRTPAQRLNTPGASPIAPFPADVYEAAQRVCQDFRPEGIQGVALKMGVPAGTLYNKLNPHESSHHKLTVQDVIQISVITADLRLLQALSRTLDCVCFPVPDFRGVSDMELLDLVAKIQVEGGQFHAALRAGFSDGRLSGLEYDAIERDALDWIGAIVETKARLAGMVRG